MSKELIKKLRGLGIVNKGEFVLANGEKSFLLYRY